MGDFEGAVSDHARAIKIDPHYAAAYHNRGNAYLALGKLSLACGDYDRAIELDAGLLDAYRNRGLALIRQGKDDQAERDFAHYLKLSENMTGIVRRLVEEARRSRQSAGSQAGLDSRR
jgi:tetratricopeptide (TPR) repeat protein